MATRCGCGAPPPPPPPRRHAIRASKDLSCHPIFVPFSKRELDRLQKTKTDALPTELSTLLRKHHTPVRTLFQFLDGDLNGSLTRFELRTALGCLGIERSQEDVDGLFLALLEVAIQDGEVQIPFRCVQKILRSDCSRVNTWLTTQHMGRQGLATRLQRAEAEIEKAEQAAAAARAREQRTAERAAEVEPLQRRVAELDAKAAQRGGQSDGLRTYMKHIETEREVWAGGRAHAAIACRRAARLRRPAHPFCVAPPHAPCCAHRRA